MHVPSFTPDLALLALSVKGEPGRAPRGFFRRVKRREKRARSVLARSALNSRRSPFDSRLTVENEVRLPRSPPPPDVPAPPGSRSPCSPGRRPWRRPRQRLGPGSTTTLRAGEARVVGEARPPRNRRGSFGGACVGFTLIRPRLFRTTSLKS